MVSIELATNNISKLGHIRSEVSDRLIQEHLFQNVTPVVRSISRFALSLIASFLFLPVWLSSNMIFAL